MDDSEETVVVEEYEPQITSSDPHERKLARRLRIQRRVETIKRQHLSDNESKDEFIEEKSLLEKQLESCNEIIDKLVEEGEEIVTNVRIGNDAREIQRRNKEESRRTELIDKLDNETTQAKELFDAIYEKWETIKTYKDPLDLHESIMMQKEQCDDLIKQKDEVIALLKEEVNLAEFKFNRDQDIQQDDISTIVKRVDSQVELMHAAYKRELNLIEETIATERKMLIDSNNKKWELLHKQCAEEESENLSDKMSQFNEFLEVFNDCRIQHEEEFRLMKINMETDLENLHQELEHLKSLCMLNSEKLDYNYQILKKREDENIVIKSQQKRLLNKLQDEMNTIRKKMNAYQVNSEIKITKLTSDIAKLRNSIIDIEAKSKHFCEVNETKFKQVWELNFETLTELINDIESIDKVIHEQLLGLEWTKDKRKLLKETDLPSYKMAQRTIREQSNIKATSVVFTPSNNEVTNSICSKILQKVAIRSNLFMESKLIELMSKLPTHYQDLISVDLVFSALGINNTEEMNLLLTYFFPYLYCPICTQQTSVSMSSRAESGSTRVLFADPSSDTSNLECLPNIMSAVHQALPDLEILVKNELDSVSGTEDEEGTTIGTDLPQDFFSERSCPTVFSKYIEPSAPKMFCKNNHPMVVSPSCVIKVIREYMAQNDKNEEKMTTISEKLAERCHTISRLLSKSDIELFWSQYKECFSESKENLWNCLLYGLNKYHAILEDRHKIYLETVKLRKQNAELRHLLGNCGPNSKKSWSKSSSLKTSQTDISKDL